MSANSPATPSGGSRRPAPDLSSSSPIDRLRARQAALTALSGSSSAESERRQLVPAPELPLGQPAARVAGRSKSGRLQQQRDAQPEPEPAPAPEPEPEPEPQPAPEPLSPRKQVSFQEDELLRQREMAEEIARLKQQVQALSPRADPAARAHTTPSASAPTAAANSITRVPSVDHGANEPPVQIAEGAYVRTDEIDFGVALSSSASTSNKRVLLLKDGEKEEVPASKLEELSAPGFSLDELDECTLVVLIPGDVELGKRDVDVRDWLREVFGSFGEFLAGTCEEKKEGEAAWPKKPGEVQVALVTFRTKYDAMALQARAMAKSETEGLRSNAQHQQQTSTDDDEDTIACPIALRYFNALTSTAKSDDDEQDAKQADTRNKDPPAVSLKSSPKEWLDSSSHESSGGQLHLAISSANSAGKQCGAPSTDRLATACLTK